MKFLPILFIVLIAAPSFAYSGNSSKFNIVVDIPNSVSADSGSGIAETISFKLNSFSSSILGNGSSPSKKLVLGFDAPIQPIIQDQLVSFMFRANIGGTVNDRVEFDSRESGVYKKNVTDAYGCIEDTITSGMPVFGLVFAGKKLEKIGVQNFTDSDAISITQAREDNKFLIPITLDSCKSVRSGYDIIRTLGLMTQAFVPLATSSKFPVEIIRDYPFDIVGEVSKSGAVQLVLDKIAGGIRISSP